MEHRVSRMHFRPVRALIVVPTRELAVQVGESIQTYGAHLPLRSTTIFGGVGMGPQLNALRAGSDIVVATPGRLLDHVSRRTINLSQVETLVLDEADRMLDMGFVHDIKRVLALLPRRRQNLLFSATFAEPVMVLAERLMNRPRLIEVAPRNSAAPKVNQTIYAVDAKRKPELLADLIHGSGWQQVLVFTRTKHGANKLVRKLERAHLGAVAIHGNKTQSARTRALASFKTGEVRVLVATDIASRGLDIDGLACVVNFELPNIADDYVHRIGRTGRAGASGEAISLVCHDEKPYLRSIERLLRVRLTIRELAGFEPNPDTTPKPVGQGTRNGTSVKRPSRKSHCALPRAGRTRRRKSQGKGQRTPA